MTGKIIDVQYPQNAAARGQDIRLILTVEGVPYDVSYSKEDVRVKMKASAVDDSINAELVKKPSVAQDLANLTGDKKRKLSDYLVKNKLICPSWPYSCSGGCKIDKA